MTVDEYIQEYNALITQCNKDIHKNMWRCVGKIALLLLIEITLIVSGVLVNELTALQYTPIAIWCGVIVLAPFAYKISKEVLDKHERYKHERYKAHNERLCALANLSIANLKKLQEEEDKDDDTN